MVDPAELADIASELESELMPGTGRVLKFDSEDDGAGGRNEDFVPGPELPCAIAPISSAGAGSSAGSRISEATTHVITFPVGTEVDPKDRVEVDDQQYEVLSLRDYGGLAMNRRAEVKAL